MGSQYRRLTPEVRREVMRCRAQGMTLRQIAARVERFTGAIEIVLRPLGGVIRRDMLEPTGIRLSLEERVEIRLGIDADQSIRAIAARLERAPSTVCREIEA